ncbi:MAG: peptidoglycan-binding domain-containing protein [Deltaproteobacteria bacterium]
MTQNIDRLDFSYRNIVDLTGTFDPSTGELSILGRSTEQFALENGGNLSDDDRAALAADLSLATRADRDDMTERVTEAADAEAELPEDYTAQGRYAEATAEGAIGEGFKGERVRTVQETLTSRGYDLGESGVDGYWGPETQTAYEAYQADGHPALHLAPGAEEEVEAVEDESEVTVDAGATARRFASASDRSGAFDPEGAAETLLDLDNASMAAVRDELETSGRPIGERIDAMEGDFLGQFAIAGRDTHYLDFMRRVSSGRRNEGDAARATPESVDAYERRLVGALEGRDTEVVNQIFAEASDEQLAELDRRFRGEGVWDADGDVLRYDEGLADYVRAITHGTLDGGGAHEHALLYRLRGATES